MDHSKSVVAEKSQFRCREEEQLPALSGYFRLSTCDASMKSKQVSIKLFLAPLGFRIEILKGGNQSLFKEEDEFGKRDKSFLMAHFGCCGLSGFWRTDRGKNSILSSSARIKRSRWSKKSWNLACSYGKMWIRIPRNIECLKFFQKLGKIRIPMEGAKSSNNQRYGTK